MYQNSIKQGSFIRNIINRCLSICSLVILVTFVSSIIYPVKAYSQKSENTEPPKRPMMQPIVLGPDDKPAFAAAPEGFDKVRENIARGKIDTIEYISKTVGTTRKMLIYIPPGYSPDEKYPVLYLLHGIGGDELEWYNNGAPDVILDNLYADKKLVPMIVVLPNGRAMEDDRFSSAPNTKAPEVLVPNPAETAQKLRLLWVSCGDQDGLISFSQGLHKYLKENNVPHVWHVEPGVHDFKVWKNDLYLFTQLIFR